MAKGKRKVKRRRQGGQVDRLTAEQVQRRRLEAEARELELPVSDYVRMSPQDREVRRMGLRAVGGVADQMVEEGVLAKRTDGYTLNLRNPDVRADLVAKLREEGQHKRADRLEAGMGDAVERALDQHADEVRGLLDSPAFADQAEALAVQARLERETASDLVGERLGQTPLPESVERHRTPSGAYAFMQLPEEEARGLSPEEQLLARRGATRVESRPQTVKVGGGVVDAQVVVGGDAGVENLTGLALEPESGRILGSVRGTPAEAVGLIDAARQTGLPIVGKAMATDMGMTHTEMDVSLSVDRDGKPTLDGPDALAFVRGLRQVAASGSPESADAQRLMDMLAGRLSAEATEVATRRGDMKRLDDLISPELSEELRSVAPGLGLTAQGKLSGKPEDVDAAMMVVEELERRLGAERDQLAAHLRERVGSESVSEVLRDRGFTPAWTATADGELWHDDTLRRILETPASDQVLGGSDMPFSTTITVDADTGAVNGVKRKQVAGQASNAEEAFDTLLEQWPDDVVLAECPALELGDDPPRLSFVGLAHIAAVGHEHGYTCRIADATLRNLDPKRLHNVVSAWRCHDERHGTFVRLAVGALPRGLKWTRQAEMFLCDVEPRTYEAMAGDAPMVPVNAAINPSPGMDPANLAAMPEDARGRRKPVWAGARALPKVWDRCAALAEVGYDAVENGRPVSVLASRVGNVGQHRAAGTIGFAMSSLRGLEQAAELLVDPDQLNALPDFDSWGEALAFAEEVALPFDAVFLDLEGPAHSYAEGRGLRAEKHVMVVRGALVTRDSAGTLLVQPYGSLREKGDEDADATYNPLGLFAFGPCAPEGRYAWATTNVADNGFTSVVLGADPWQALSRGDAVRLTSDEEEYGDGPSGAVVLTTLSGEGETDIDALGVACAEVAMAAMTALRAMFLATMSNVELVEAPMSRQVRRQRERKGDRTPIALSVLIKVNRKSYAQRHGDEERATRNYTHRFRRRGSTAHYPVGTRMADARPDELRACGKHGKCRRIYRPPTIVGPDHLPLVLKSLRVQD